MLNFEPPELVFEGFVNGILSKNLIIKNPSKEESVVFKLKATTSLLFSVNPKVGVLGPDEKVDITLKFVAPDAHQESHLLLVQAAVASGDVTDLHEFWNHQNSTDIWNAEIKCVLKSSLNSEIVAEIMDWISMNLHAFADQLRMDPEEVSRRRSRIDKENKYMWACFIMIIMAIAAMLYIHLWL